MKMDLTDFVIVLDSSRSMEKIKGLMESALNEYIDDQKQIPTPATVTLVRFNSKAKVEYAAKPIQEVKQISLVPCGMTALYDALGSTIDSVGKRLSDTPEDERPGKVLFVIITDGEENSSEEYGQQQVFDMVQHQTDVYNWQFTYLGANQDSFKEAAKIGIPKKSTLDYDTTRSGIKGAAASLSYCTQAYRDGADFAFSDQDRSDAKN